MPIYEYQCRECLKVEEVLQKFSDKPLSTCRHCSGKMDKLISQSAFHLKGSGWYVTDYAKKGSGSDKTTSKKTPTSSDSSDSTKSTSKSPSSTSE